MFKSSVILNYLSCPESCNFSFSLIPSAMFSNKSKNWFGDMMRIFGTRKLNIKMDAVFSPQMIYLILALYYVSSHVGIFSEAR